MTWPPKKEKIDRFLGGLNPQLRCTLGMLDFPDFQTLANKAFIAEREHKLVSDTRLVNNDNKRKFEPKKDGQPVQKARTWQQTQVEYKPNWQQNVNNTTTQVKNVVTNPMHEERQRNNSCFSCGQNRHYARQCPKNNKANALIRPQVNFMESWPIQQNSTGHVHHISADEAQEKPEVVIGMFSVNDIPVIILFDSGASHSAQNNFPCTILGKNMLVQTPDL